MVVGENCRPQVGTAIVRGHIWGGSLFLGPKDHTFSSASARRNWRPWVMLLWRRKLRRRPKGDGDAKIWRSQSFEVFVGHSFWPCLQFFLSFSYVFIWWIGSTSRNRLGIDDFLGAGPSGLSLYIERSQHYQSPRLSSDLDMWAIGQKESPKKLTIFFMFPFKKPSSFFFLLFWVCLFFPPSFWPIAPNGGQVLEERWMPWSGEWFHPIASCPLKREGGEMFVGCAKKKNGS